MEYSPLVIREAVVNLLVHRDFRQGIKSTIEVRPSSIILFNPATLFSPTITTENLKRQHPSRPGNKLIAKIFYMMGMFENWGSGTLQIMEGALADGKAEPDFIYQDGMFRLILHR
jgi:ATP-dependent DNA helicase RecG